eukprot:1142859-Pelagomonas_calceolata.AAC.12
MSVPHRHGSSAQGGIARRVDVGRECMGKNFRVVAGDRTLHPKRNSYRPCGYSGDGRECMGRNFRGVAGDRTLHPKRNSYRRCGYSGDGRECIEDNSMDCHMTEQRGRVHQDKCQHNASVPSIAALPVTFNICEPGQEKAGIYAGSSLHSRRTSHQLPYTEECLPGFVLHQRQPSLLLLYPHTSPASMNDKHPSYPHYIHMHTFRNKGRQLK